MNPMRGAFTFICLVMATSIVIGPPFGGVASLCVGTFFLMIGLNSR